MFPSSAQSLFRLGHAALHVSRCLEYHEIALRILGKELFELQGRSGADIDLHARKHRLEPMGVIPNCRL